MRAPCPTLLDPTRRTRGPADIPGPADAPGPADPPGPAAQGTAPQGTPAGGGPPFSAVPSPERPPEGGPSLGPARRLCPLPRLSVLGTSAPGRPSRTRGGWGSEPPPDVSPGDRDRPPRAVPHRPPSLADAQRLRPPARLPAPRCGPFSHPGARVAGKCRLGSKRSPSGSPSLQRGATASEPGSGEGGCLVPSILPPGGREWGVPAAGSCAGRGPAPASRPEGAGRRAAVSAQRLPPFLLAPRLSQCVNSPWLSTTKHGHCCT